jgi:hypothetical protein
MFKLNKQKLKLLINNKNLRIIGKDKFFLNSANFSRWFILRYSKVIKLLTDLF